MMLTRRTLILVAVLVLGPCIKSTVAQSEVNIAQQFVGTWRLVSWQQRLADGTTRPSAISVAFLIYTDVNRMCSVGMNPNRAKWNSATAPTESEALAGMGTRALYAYCATVEIHANEGFVLHHVEVDKAPNDVGRTRKRWFTFEGPNRISLRIDTPELIAPVVESTLLWERVTK